MELRFIADSNVGKLAKWLRLMGYDTLFFKDVDDNLLIEIALNEGRILLTRDTRLVQRRVVTGVSVAKHGTLKAILLQEDNPKLQLRQVVKELNLELYAAPFTRCMECNCSLTPRHKDEVRKLVPPYVFRTQSQFMQCEGCNRIYWRGTHWQRMHEELQKLIEEQNTE